MMFGGATNAKNEKCSHNLVCELALKAKIN